MIISKILLIVIPVIGIFLLIRGIRMLLQFFNQKLILEIPYTCKYKNFQLSKSGTYSIWHKGKLFQKAPVDKYKPVIINESTGEKALLNDTLFRTNVNNGATARMQLFTFSAPAGNYRLELAEGTSVSHLEKSFSYIIPVKEMETAGYFIQIRETQPKYLVFLGIPMTIIGFSCVIGGIVLFATFEQWIDQV